MGPRVKKDWPKTKAKIGPNFVMKGNLILLPGATMSSGFKVTGILDMAATKIKKPTKTMTSAILAVGKFTTTKGTIAAANTVEAKTCTTIPTTTISS